MDVISNTLGRRSVETTLNYSKALTTTECNEKWFTDIISSPDGSRISNFENNPVQIIIQDLRDREYEAGLDKTGFQFFSYPTQMSAQDLLSAESEIEKVYYPELEALLKKTTGADKIVFFDYTIRVNQPDLPEGQDPLIRQPLFRVHVDQTPVSANARVQLHAPDTMHFRRCQIINIWRPIGNTVYDHPLALADFRSLDLNVDLEPTEIRYPPWMRDKETYSVRYNPKYRWYYWSHMTPDELIMFKCYDSQSQGLSSVKKSSFPVKLEDTAGLCPHSAFLDEEGLKIGIKRQSIEVRALVFHM